MRRGDILQYNDHLSMLPEVHRNAYSDAGGFSEWLDMGYTEVRAEEDFSKYE